MYAGILRKKVILLIFRVMFLSVLLIGVIIYSSPLLYYFLLLYFAWAVKKNFYYVGKAGAVFYLPLIQLLSDVAVFLGTVFGGIGLFFRFLKRT